MRANHWNTTGYSTAADSSICFTRKFIQETAWISMAGQMMKPVCLVMVQALMFSLIEALLILPAHLAPASKVASSPTALLRVRATFNRGLQNFVHQVYVPLLEKALAWRYLTIAIFIVLLMLAAALVRAAFPSGRRHQGQLLGLPEMARRYALQ